MAGFEIVGCGDFADVYVLNSCTVTGESDRKMRQQLRRMRKQNPDAVICLCGCFPQAYPDDALKIPEADIVLGVKNRQATLSKVREKLACGRRVINIAPHILDDTFEESTAGSLVGRSRAYVKIQDGCNRFCAYCVVPYARGSSRSRTLDDIRRELNSLAARGYLEVVLTGVNLSCYGQDIECTLPEAVSLACNTPGIERVRLGSLEPDLLTDSIISELAKLPKLCPHFHLSLQSGCNNTLERMRRLYTCEEYLRIVTLLRLSFTNAAITTDIMAGFPGETQHEFESSLKFFEKVGFAGAHVFAYSQRPGTLAADMPEQLSKEEKRRRTATLLQAARKSEEAFLETQVGKTAQVLFESHHHADGAWEGYAENYVRVLVYRRNREPNADRASIPNTDHAGKIATVRIDSIGDGAAFGILSER